MNGMTLPTQPGGSARSALLLMLTCSLGVMTLVYPRQGRADAVSETSLARADRLFAEGQALLESHDPAVLPVACADLLESQRLDPKLGRLLNLAVCHERQNKTATAYDEFREAAEWAARKGQKEREDYARGQADALSKQLSLVQIDLPPTVASSEVTVTIDDSPMDRTRWTRPFALDPGPHVAILRVSGKRQRRLSFYLTGPGTTSLTVPVFQTESEGISRRTWGLVVGGAGIVALGFGSYLGGVAISKRAQADPHCPGHICDATGAGYIGDARSAATGSTVLLVVAGVSIVGGGILMLWPNKSYSVGITPVVGTTYALMRWEGTFP
jgi:hypothetical protein